MKIKQGKRIWPYRCLICANIPHSSGKLNTSQRSTCIPRFQWSVEMTAPSTRQSPAILDLRQRKTPSNKSNDTRTYIDFKTLLFQNVFLPHKYEKPDSLNSSGRKSVRKLLGFRDGLERTVGQSVELRKLRFHIFPALCGCCLRNSAIIGLRVARVSQNSILMLFAFEECSINSLLSIQAQRCRYVKRPLKEYRSQLFEFLSL